MGQIYDNAHLARHSERRGMGSIVRSNGGALDGRSLYHMLNLHNRFAPVTKTPMSPFLSSYPDLGTISARIGTGISQF